jgi:hypothetical protein
MEMSDPDNTLEDTNGYPFDDEDDDCCWRCHGEGGWHDCGEDCCCCLDPEAIDENWVWCDECGGKVIP